MRASRNLLLLFLLISSHDCSNYNSPNESCPIEEYYRYDGVEYTRCYR